MATVRSIEYWYNLMVAEKQTMAELSGLLPIYNLQGLTPDNPFMEFLEEVNNGSQVAVWKFEVHSVAVAMFTQDLLWEATQQEQEQIAANSVVANAPWYADQVKKWQYGDLLLFNSLTYRYYYADEVSTAAVAKRLVKQVAVTEVFNGTFNGVVIKVRGANGPLDNTPGTEEDSLKAFLSEVKPAGVQTTIINLPADSVRLHLKVYYDGVLILADFKTVVEAALATYFNTIQFNGIFYINNLIDAMQQVTGTKEPWTSVIKCECKAATDAAYTVVTERYEPVSGHFQIIPISNTVDVDTVIEYIPA